MFNNLKKKKMKKFLLAFCLIICAGAIFARKKVETSYRNTLIFAYSQVNSVYEDDNIKLQIYNQALWAINKTSKTIFIDLDQCFLNHNGSSRPIYSKDQDERSASKAGLSSSLDQYLTLAPSTGSKLQNETMICNLATNIFGKYTTTETPSGDFTDYDNRLLELVDYFTTESLKSDPKGKQYLGTVTRHFTEDESVNNIGASIAYAFNKKAEEWTTVVLSTWVCDAIFAPCYAEIPDGIDGDERKGFAAKQTKPVVLHIKADTPFEFSNDKSPLVVCDWSGNLKKGTFKLQFARVRRPIPLFSKEFAGMSVEQILMSPNLYYKDVLQFDGANADWGVMKYEKIEYVKTGQIVK